MKKETLLIIFGVVLAFVTGRLVYFYFKSKEIEEKNEKLQKDNLRLVVDSIKQTHSLSDEIKRQLTNMISQYQNIDMKVANELSDSIKLMEGGNIENAIQNLVKIIEYLLNTHYEKDAGFRAWLKSEKKKFDLFGMLTFCKVEKKISEVEYQFLIAVKKIRDKEVHTIDFKVDEYLNASGLITAVGGVIKLSTVVYPQKSIQ